MALWGITASADNETLSLEISGPIAMRIIRSEISPRPFALVEMMVVRESFAPSNFL